MKGHERAVNHTIENSHHDDKEKEENNCVNSLCCRLKPCPFIIYSSSSRNSVVDTIKKEKSCVHHIAVSKDWKNEIIFCITNEISFTIISLSSSDKFFLESGILKELIWIKHSLDFS